MIILSPISLSLHLMVPTIHNHMSDLVEGKMFYCCWKYFHSHQSWRDKGESFSHPENCYQALTWSWRYTVGWNCIELKESYFILSQISGLAAPLWVTVFSTRKIFTTRSTTSLSITSKVSTWQCQLNGRREENWTPQSQREASGQSSWSWEGRPQWRLGPCRQGKREEKEGNNFPREPPEEGTLPRRQESEWPSRWSGGENHFPFLGRVHLVLLGPTCRRAFARFLPKAPIRKHLDIKSLLWSS